MAELALPALLLCLVSAMPAEPLTRAGDDQPPMSQPATSQPVDQPLDDRNGDDGDLEPRTDALDPNDPRAMRDDEDSERAPQGLTLSLSLGGARDSGLRGRGALATDIENDAFGATSVAGGTDLEDTAYVVVPSLLLHRRPSRRSELLLAYQPEIERFETHEEWDATHHAVGGRFEHLASRRSRLVVGGSLLDGEDPSRHLGGQLLVLPRTPYSQSRLYAGLEHSWTSTELLFYVGWSATEMEAAGTLLETGIDESEYVATLTLDRTLGARSGLTASYSVVMPDWSDPLRFADPPGDVILKPTGEPTEGGDALPTLRFDDPLHTAMVGFTVRPADGIRLHVAGGVQYGEEATYLASAGIARDAEVFSFGFRYERSLLTFGSFSSAGVGGAGGPPFATGPGSAAVDAVAQTLTATFALRPIERLRLEQHLWGARTELLPGEPLESFAATSRVLVELVRRLGIFGQYEWLEQSGRPLPQDLSRSRVSAGIVVGLTGPPETWGVRGEAPQLRRVLPSWRNE